MGVIATWTTHSLSKEELNGILQKALDLNEKVGELKVDLENQIQSVNESTKHSFTIINGIEVDLNDYIDDKQLIAQFVNDESFKDGISFKLEKELAAVDNDLSGNEILEKIVYDAIKNKTGDNVKPLNNEKEER